MNPTNTEKKSAAIKGSFYFVRRAYLAYVLLLCARLTCLLIGSSGFDASD